MVKRNRLMGMIAVIVIFSLGCGLVDQALGSTSTSPQQVNHQPPALPQPPILPAIPTGSEEQKAAYIADLLASGDAATRLSAWLGIYDALGIPVINEDGFPITNTGDDPIGPHYWLVWVNSGYDLPGRGITLMDAGRLLAAGLPGFESNSLSQVFNDDLRNTLNSTDPQVRLMGNFVRERILRGPSHLDLADPLATYDQMIIDLPTVELLSWVLLREGIFQGFVQAMAFTDTTLISFKYDHDRLPMQQTSNQVSCSDIPGAGSDFSYWSQWLANKLGGGFQLPGMQEAFPSILERVLSQVFSGKGQTFVDKANKIGGAVLGYSTAVTSAISLILQLESMTINPAEDPNPLVRTKSSTYPGENGQLKLQLYSDPQSIPDGNELETCLASFFYNALGVGMTFPSQGPVAGAEMSIQGGVGFPGLVLFNINGTTGMDQTLRASTDESGFAYFKVVGAPQKQDVPDTAESTPKEFSVLIKAQPEEAGINSIANIFFDGLSFGTAPGMAAALTSLVDLLKTFTYDMGEYYFDLKDWIHGYVVDVSFMGFGGEVHLFGKICDGLERPFTLNESTSGNMYSAILTFHPTSKDGGTFDMEGIFTNVKPPQTITGSGTYVIDKSDLEGIKIHVLGGQMNIDKLQVPMPEDDSWYLSPARDECK